MLVKRPPPLTRRAVDARRWLTRLAPLKHFTAIIHRGEPGEGGYWATCLEVPGANGQGESREDCLQDLAAAIRLLLESEREEVFRLDPLAETADLVVA